MSRWIVLTDSTPSQVFDTTHCLRTPSGRTALRWIEDQRLPVCGVILTPDSWDEDFSTLVARCRQLRPGTPIYTLMDGPGNTPGAMADPAIQQRLGLSAALTADELPQFLRRKMQTEVSSKTTRDPIVNEGAFVGVPLSDFEQCESLFFDLHLKLSSGKFLRLMDARETQPWSRIVKYRERGVTHLYIAREAYERSLMAIRLFKETIPDIPRSGDSSWSEIQIAHSLRSISGLMADQKVLEQIDLGIWEKCHELLYLFGRALTEREIERDPQQMHRWMRRCLFLDHSLSVFLISTLIGRPLQFTSTENMMSLGAAALFHDIVLLDMERIPAEERSEGLTGKELEAFLRHPEDSARFIEERFDAPAVVIQAIQHHHWRYDGTGLAASGRRNPVFVPRMAEIIGLAEECSKMLTRDPSLDLPAAATMICQNMSTKFSPEVLSGLRPFLAFSAE